MRGLLCFLLLFALTVNMNARPQADTRITLKLDNVTLTKAMNEIKQQSRFLFINKGVDAGKIVSINVESETINNVCKALFTPVNVAFTIEGNNIIITNANVNDKKGGPVTITGTIRDAAGEPVPGAGVVESGTTNGTVTDLDGKYSLRVSDKGVTIEVNCLGYEPAKFEVGNATVYNTVLHEESLSLEGTVVTALGIRKEEKSLSYNVQKVGGDIINAVKEANFVNSLQGKVAGLQINQSASGAGGGIETCLEEIERVVCGRCLKLVAPAHGRLCRSCSICILEFRSNERSGESCVVRVVYTDFSFLAFLGSDENYTVCSLCTVKCCCRST